MDLPGPKLRTGPIETACWRRKVAALSQPLWQRD
jgi:hypothetical protein